MPSKNVTANLDEHIRQLLECDSMDSIRGIEGNAASQYFSAFDQLILQNKEEFFFENRNRRPPLDNVNAMYHLHTHYWQMNVPQL